MSTESFTKTFVLSKEGAERLAEMLYNPPKSVNINRSLTVSEKEKQAEIKIRKILFERRYEAGKNI